MPAAIPLAAHQSLEEISSCFHASSGDVEKLRWQAVLLKKKGYSRQSIADVTDRSPRWVTTTIKLYNAEGPAGLRDKREDNGAELVLDESGQQALQEAMSKSPPEGGLWTGQKVLNWLKNRLGRELNLSTAYDYIHRLGLSLQVPRPQETRSDKAGQEALKKGG